MLLFKYFYGIEGQGRPHSSPPTDSVVWTKSAKAYPKLLILVNITQNVSPEGIFLLLIPGNLFDLFFSKDNYPENH